MFEHHREQRAAEAHAAALRDWQVRHDAAAALVETARTYTGVPDDGLLLDAGETVYLRVDDSQLVEERRGRGTYVGRSQGISVPVARVGGRQIRYRVGVSKGHYVQGQPVPTAIDTGATFITSSRVVFRGAAQTRECTYAKLLAVDHDPVAGTTTLSVSNRSRPTTIHYGPACAATVEFRLDLSLARFRGTVDDLLAELDADLAAVDSMRPPDVPRPVGAADRADPDVPPVVAPPAPAVLDPPPGAGRSEDQAISGGEPEHVPDPTAASAHDPGAAGPGPAVAAGWYPDPWATAPLRWWTGSAWSWQTVDPSAPTPA